MATDVCHRYKGYTKLLPSSFTHMLSTWVHALPPPLRRRERADGATEADAPAIISLGGAEIDVTPSISDSPFVLLPLSARGERLVIVIDANDATRPSVGGVAEAHDKFVKIPRVAPPLPGALPVVFSVFVLVLLNSPDVIAPDGTPIGPKSLSPHSGQSKAGSLVSPALAPAGYMPSELKFFVVRRSDGLISLPSCDVHATRDGDPLASDASFVSAGIHAAAACGIDVKHARRWARLLTTHYTEKDKDGTDFERINVTLICFDAAASAVKQWYPSGPEGSWDIEPEAPMLAPAAAPSSVQSSLPKKRARPVFPEPPKEPCLLVANKKVEVVSVSEVRTVVRQEEGAGMPNTTTDAVTGLSADALFEIMIRDSAAVVAAACSLPPPGATGTASASAAANMNDNGYLRAALGAFRMLDVDATGFVRMSSLSNLLQCGGGRLSHDMITALIKCAEGAAVAAGDERGTDAEFRYAAIAERYARSLQAN